ncbi:F-box and leucine-rich repeat protein 2/20 [Microdochium nivale]|nr:F-box and leucine-rich repeat protein 2/20 [Microdochium nivale]
MSRDRDRDDTAGHGHGTAPVTATTPASSASSSAASSATATTSHSNATSAMTAPATSDKKAGFAALPDALILQIFEHVGLGSKKALSSVSRLNRRYHGLADSILYKRVHFDTPELHLVFSESLQRRPRRGSAIYDISLSYPTSELERLAHAPEHGNHYTSPPLRVDGLSRTISAMSNLESLNIAVPETLLHGIGALFNGPFDLACLKSCHLFYQCPEDRYWDLQENIHIFSHPSLETLVIRRAKLDYRGFESIERPHETALQKLHFIECDINDDALSDILEFPEGLREFVMTQLPEPVPELEDSSDDAGDYLIALRAQAPTLESITIDVATLGGRKTLRMREFTKLKTLRLNWDYHLFGKTSRKARLHSIGLPPNMETLELFNELGTDEGVTDLMVSMLQIGTILATKWDKFIVVADEDGKIPQVIVDACKQGGVELEIIGQAEEEEEDQEAEEEQLVEEPEEMSE